MLRGAGRADVVYLFSLWSGQVYLILEGVDVGVVLWVGEAAVLNLVSREVFAWYPVRISTTDQLSG